MTRQPARATVHARKVAAALYAPDGEIPEKPARKKARDIEGPIHRSILAWLRVALPAHAVVFHVPNGGARNAIVGGKLKALGTVAGIPDLCVILRGKVYFLEVKAPGGTESRDQIAVFERLQQAGACVAVARSVTEVRDIVRRWGIATREVTP